MAVSNILFRGRSLETGEWVYGYFVNCASMYDDPEKDRVAEIIEVGADRIYTGEYDYNRAHEVYPETVGQWTGLVDKNGVKIFGGDVMHNAGNVVEYCFGSFCINGDSLLSFWTGTEVIGNIWDNPELVKSVSE